MRAMRSMIVAAALAAALPGVAFADEDPRGGGLTAVIACFSARTQQLDDGVSDAGTIARAVASTCTEERLEADRIFTADMGKRARTAFMATADDRYRDLALQVVLAERAKARERRANR
ncbi:MAG: hypothetical protein ACK4RV_02170 [Caulobacter sp.]